MSKTTNIRLFTEILNSCEFNNQTDDTKRKLQYALKQLLKKAQDKCVSRLVKLQQQKGNRLDGLSREGLKEEARKLMHVELQSLVNAQEFMKTCQDIIVATHRPQISLKLRNIKSKNSNTSIRFKRRPQNASSMHKNSSMNTFSSKKSDSQTKRALSSQVSESTRISRTLTNSNKQSVKASSDHNSVKSTGRNEYTKKKVSPILKTSVSVPAANPTKIGQKSVKPLKSCKSSRSAVRSSATKNCLSNKENVFKTQSLQYRVKETKVEPTKISPSFQYTKQPSSSNISNVSSTRESIKSKLQVKASKLSIHLVRSSPKLSNNPSAKQPQKNASNLWAAHAPKNTKYLQSLVNASRVSTPVKLDVRREMDSLSGSAWTRFQKIKECVELAMNQRRTFTSLGSQHARRSLLNRGWVERIVTNKNHTEALIAADRMSMLELFNNLDHDSGGLYTRVLKSKLLANHQVDLIWDPRPYVYTMIKNAKKPVYLNRYRKRGEYDFCSKIGLCKHMRNLRWNYKRNVADVYFPRTYILSNNEMDDFIYDFRITACMALLKWSIQRGRSDKAFVSKDGKVPIDAFFFAVLQCIGFIKRCKDCEFKLSYSLQTWNNFIDHYHECVYRGEHFCSNANDNVNDMLAQAAEVLGRARLHRPELDYEGNYNVWIIKPDQYSRGMGIHVCRRMCQIKELIARNGHLRYLIQKYIERPLLIYNTKFDIRQWFLISCSVPLTVWMYKEFYLRFSSQQYQLTRFHESIHLTNNSVQSKYKNHACRDPNLPRDNMWDSHRFEQYLQNAGFPDAVKNIIYPKMKQAIMAVLLSAKDDMDQRPHSFELYGADFMLTSDFQPWLIEVNSHPAMSASTSVTAKMCPEVIEDVIKGKNILLKFPPEDSRLKCLEPRKLPSKGPGLDVQTSESTLITTSGISLKIKYFFPVVVDGARVPECNKGKFELIYKDKVPKIPKPPQEGFFVYGTPLSLHYFKLIDESMKRQTALENSESSSNLLPDLNKKIKKLVAPTSSTCSTSLTSSASSTTHLANVEIKKSSMTLLSNSQGGKIETLDLSKDNYEIDNPQKFAEMEKSIETTRKIVHMRSILKSLVELLDRETRRPTSTKSTLSSTFSTAVVKKADIESAIQDIQETIDTLSKGEEMRADKSMTCGVLSNKTCLLPKTLTNLITVLTMSLYAKNSASFIS